MRVCFISPYSPKEISGVGRFISELSTGLSEYSIQSMVITRKIKNEKKVPLEVIEIDFPQYRFIGGFIFTLKSVSKIIKSRNKIETILLQRPFILSQAIFALISRSIGLRTISVIHGRYPAFKSRLGFKLTRLIERFTFHLSNSVVFVDKRGMQLRNYKAGILIENGVNVQHFRSSDETRKRIRKELKIQDEDLNIIFVGRVSYDKGIYELINAISVINNKDGDNLKALIIGPIVENEEKKIAQLIKDNNLEDKILFLGMVDDVQPYYCAADLFVLPSYEEGLPLVLLEAMACGLPVIVSKIGGMPFVVEDHKDGLLIEPKDTDDLIEKIRWFIKNPEKMGEMGIIGNRKIAEKYSLTRMTRDYVKILKQ